MRAAIVRGQVSIALGARVPCGDHRVRPDHGVVRVDRSLGGKIGDPTAAVEQRPEQPCPCAERKHRRGVPA